MTSVEPEAETPQEMLERLIEEVLERHVGAAVGQLGSILEDIEAATERLKDEQLRLALLRERGRDER